MSYFDLRFIPSCEIEKILPLYRLIDDKISHDLMKIRFQTLLKGDYKIIAVYPPDSNKPVGMAGLSFGVRVYCGNYIELHHMVVDPEWRGSGVGKKLLKYAESYARIRDVDALCLDSYYHAAEAHILYQGHGYQDIGKHFIKIL